MCEPRQRRSDSERQRLLDHGLPQDANGRILFPRDVVEKAIETAPSSFTLFDRVRVEPTDQSFHEAIAFARENGLEMSVRGGGHNIAGYSVCDNGVMLDFGIEKVLRDAVIFMHMDATVDISKFKIIKNSEPGEAERRPLVGRGSIERRPVLSSRRAVPSPTMTMTSRSGLAILTPIPPAIFLFSRSTPMTMATSRLSETARMV